MICKRLAAGALAAAAGFSFPAWPQAAGSNLGRNLAASCANCHGTNGSSTGGIPSLAGQPSQVLVRALMEFREGKRPASIMHQLSKGYSDEQLALVAAFFSTQKAR